MADPFNLQRFVDAQFGVIEQVLAELNSGCKRSHWMWFIFPQVAGLGRSATARFYALSGLEEARAFLAHPVLGERLRESCRVLLRLKGRSAVDVFGAIDALKLHSCMTLFAQVADEESIFNEVLAAYYEGVPDAATLEILGNTC